MKFNNWTNYQAMWIDIKGLIDCQYPYPQHQGTTDLTEVIEFAQLAEEHKLTDKQYDMIIDKAQKYHDKIDKEYKGFMNSGSRIFDDGGKTIDRYTLITADNSMYGFNDEPFHPQGFGQYCGTWQGGATGHLGKRISLKDLPTKQAKTFVRQRIH